MKILVTGASGFIGSYLCSYLVQQGHQVIAAMRSINTETTSLLSGAELLQLDVLNQDHLEMQVQADAIVHTATSNDIVSKDTLAGIQLSAIGTKNMLDFAVKNNIPKFICFSTFQVYGTELTGVITEAAATGCLNDYGLNHLFAEQYVAMYARNKKITGVAVRPSNVYGEIKTNYINRWTLVPACFCLEAFEKQTITILSSGKQVRNFVSLENVSIGVESILKNYPAQFEIYNIAGSQTFDMLAVAEKVKNTYCKMFNKSIEIIVKGTVPESGNRFEVDCKKITATGYKENKAITLETEIEKIFSLLVNKNNQ